MGTGETKRKKKKKKKTSDHREKNVCNSDFSEQFFVGGGRVIIFYDKHRYFNCSYRIENRVQICKIFLLDSEPAVNIIEIRIRNTYKIQEYMFINTCKKNNAYRSV